MLMDPEAGRDIMEWLPCIRSPAFNGHKLVLIPYYPFFLLGERQAKNKAKILTNPRALV
jgi:hypothetical protein